MTVGNTASELEAMIMEKLRHGPACVALYRVGVIPAGESTKSFGAMVFYGTNS